MNKILDAVFGGADANFRVFRGIERSIGEEAFPFLPRFRKFISSPCQLLQNRMAIFIFIFSLHPSSMSN